MKTSEGKKTYTIELTEIDITILLEALGAKQNSHFDRGIPTRAITYLIDRIYRAMGVRLD